MGIGILTGILVLVAVFMIFLIMLQEGKGGGLTALGGTKAAGIEGVTNPIRRATGYMAGLFFILAIVLAIINRPQKTNDFFEAEARPAALTTTPAPAQMGPATPMANPAPTAVVPPTVVVTPTAPATSTAAATSTAPATSIAPTTSTKPADTKK